MDIAFRKVFLGLCVLGSLHTGLAWSQVGESQKEEPNVRLKERGKEESVVRTLPDLSPQALETPIDADTYIIGPGDVFVVNVLEREEYGVRTMVTPEGKLIVPSLGVFSVAGEALSHVQQMVREEGRKQVKTYTIEADLAELRRFRVHVLGAVTEPGTYVAMAVDRVSALVERAGGPSDMAMVQAIEVRHADGSTSTVDLFAFQHWGKLDQNIYVSGGDVIYVPYLKLTGKKVRVEGLYITPGLHEISDGETARELLHRVNAINRKVDLQEIYVVRATADGGKEMLKVNLLGDASADGVSSDLPLLDGDVLVVPSIQDTVFVQGAVKNPGGYPYVVGWRAREYAGAAGATENTASLKNTKVIHRNSDAVESGADVPVRRGDTIVVPLVQRKKFTEYLTIVTSFASVLIAAKAVGLIK